MLYRFSKQKKEEVKKVRHMIMCMNIIAIMKA